MTTRARAHLAGLLLAAALGISPASAQLPGRSAGLLEQVGWIQLHLVGGRLLATSPYDDRNTTASTTLDDRRERLSILLESGRPSLRYERTSTDESLVLEITRGEAFRVVRTQSRDAARTRVTLEQPQRGPLSFEIAVEGGPDEVAGRFQARSLWHLLLLYPKSGGEHLVPLLHWLEPEWKVDSFVAELEEALLATAGTGGAAQRRRWADWVEQLGHEQYARRQAAHRQLLRAGPQVVPFLRQLDLAALDAEQRSRVRRILAAVAGQMTPDVPPRAAAWLAADPCVWAALLARDDPRVRAVALEQLRDLIGAGVELPSDVAEAITPDQWQALVAACCDAPIVAEKTNSAPAAGTN